MKYNNIATKIACLGVLFIGLSQSIVSQTKYFTITSSGVVESENSLSPSRTIVEETSKSITIDYNFSGFSVADMETDGSLYQVLRMEGFGLSLKTGAPSLPYRAEKIALPDKEKPLLSIITANYIELNGYSIIPAPKLPTDGNNDLTRFIADKEVYSTDAFYPPTNVSLGQVKTMKEISMAILKLNPVQYNPATGRLRICTTLTIRIDYGTTSNSIAKTALPATPNPILQNIIINPINTDQSYLEKAGSYSLEPTGYIIVTTPKFKDAADTLANWKRQLGYRVDILSQTTWTVSQVATAVRNKYYSTYPRPAYLLILGDQEDVPDYYYENVYLDPPLPVYSTNYYACMDGSGDYIPEMAHGRIPVKSLNQAIMVIKKIVNYEKFPPADPTFYRKGLHAGYFQDSVRKGIAEKRYAHTSIELYNYMKAQGYNSDRVFYTEPDVTPVMFNPYYSGNTTIPAEYLKKNGYLWDGDKQDIINDINDGRFYVFHRDHGLQKGWVSPQMDTSDLNALHNGNETPVVLSINCSSGMFWKTGNVECFAEKWLHHPNGGAVGVVASTEENRSGYNDGFIVGMIDAIWPNPGIIPDFGTGKDPDPKITSHGPIYTMGDVMIQGLIRMTETWDSSGWADRDHFNLYHYFGDPAMQIWTDIPIQATAQHANSIVPGTASISVSGSNCSDGIATVFYNNNIQSKIRLSGGSGTLTFPNPLDKSIEEIVLTISKHNYIPYQAIIQVGNQPIAQFSSNVRQICPNNSIEFFDESENGPESWTWEITPSNIQFINGTNLNSQNPEVLFTESGSYQVKLTASSSEGSNSITKSNYITVFEVPDAPLVDGAMFCDQGSALLTVRGVSGNYKWWNSFDKQILLSQAESFQTPVLDQTTSYFVEALPDLPSGELSTIYASTNYANGNMFDLTAHKGIRIDSFSVNVNDYLDHTIEVYYKQGTFEGSETNPDNWTLLGAYPVTGRGSDIPANVDIDDIQIVAGNTYGFYITLTSGTLGYTHGGNIYTGDDISIFCGAGVSYPFSTVYTPRTWNGTVHYSVTQYGCSSELAEVQVIITPTPEPPEDQYHEVCYDTDSIILQVDGENLLWYSDSQLTDLITEGKIYQPFDLEVGINSYYVTERTSSCTSGSGKIFINLHEPVELPVANDYSICLGDTAILIAKGDSIRWYENEVLLTETDTLLINGNSDGMKIYKVTNTFDGCESKPLFVELQVHPIPPVPKSMNQTACEKDTVVLTAEGSEINWYDYADMSLFMENEDTIILKAIEPGEHKFIVTNKENGCESDTIQVAVLAKDLPSLPTLIQSSFCEDEYVSLQASGENLRWFADEFKQELLSDSSIFDAGYLETGSHMYFLDQSVDGCVSELNPQEVIVNYLPNVDLGNDTIIYLGQEITITTNVVGEHTWQDSSTGNSFSFVADDFGVGHHRVEVYVTNEANCTASDLVMVEVKKPLGIDPKPDGGLLLVYPNPTSGLITIEFTKTIDFPVLISMYDVSGRCVLKKEIEYMEKGDQMEMDLSGKAKGIYMLILQDQGSESNYCIIRK